MRGEMQLVVLSKILEVGNPTLGAHASVPWSGSEVPGLALLL